MKGAPEVGALSIFNQWVFRWIMKKYNRRESDYGKRYRL
jgi:hypothetical protein